MKPTLPKGSWTPNEGDWCVCGGVFGRISRLCTRCGLPKTKQNTWKLPEIVRGQS